MNYYSYLSNVTLLKLQSLPANSLVNPIIIDQCRFLAIDLYSLQYISLQTVQHLHRFQKNFSEIGRAHV